MSPLATYHKHYLSLYKVLSALIEEWYGPFEVKSDDWLNEMMDDLHVVVTDVPEDRDAITLRELMEKLEA